MDTKILQAIIDANALFIKTNGQEGAKADLRRADLRRANLRRANLQGADLQGADLSWANLQGADLRRADLSWANLQGTNLQGTNLQGADLSWANLQGTNLQGADLQGADLQGADLQGADLQGAIGNMREVKSGQIELFDFVYTATDLFVGYQKKTITEWWEWDCSDRTPEEREAWNRLSPVLRQLVEASPAIPSLVKD